MFPLKSMELGNRHNKETKPFSSKEKKKKKLYQA